MLKGLSRLWWQGVKRLGKAQKSQNRKLVKSLLAPPAKGARPKTRLNITSTRASGRSTTGPIASAAGTGKTKVSAAPEKKRIAKIDETSGRLPGKWLSSYYSAFSDDGNLPARRMSYWLYLPDRATTTGLPLVVMLHGCGQSAAEFAQGTRMNRLAEQKGFAVLYPQQSLRSHPQRCWPWYEKTIQQGGGEVKLIAGAIDKVARQYELDMTRIYVAGLSAGAAMAHILGLTHPHLIAAVGLHSGPVFGAGHTRMGAYRVMQGGSVKASGNAMDEVVKTNGVLPQIPAILMHGGADKVVRPINQMQLTRQFLMLNRLGPGNATRAVYKLAGRSKKNPANPHRIQDYVAGKKLLLRVCEINHLEHAWSGGDGALNHMTFNGPDASKMMWAFFARHRRPGIRPAHPAPLRTVPLARTR